MSLSPSPLLIEFENHYPGCLSNNELKLQKSDWVLVREFHQEKRQNSEKSEVQQKQAEGSFSLGLKPDQEIV